ncbi:MAG: glycerophosphodiester phosphodiesterase [Candidatus Hermodarchaeota archaeon]
MNDNNEILIIGHAGGKKTGPENTLKAFNKALELKADYIELDLRMSKDNEVIIFHDPDTFNITAEPGLVKNKTLKELKKLDVGEGERIPTFREIIEFANNKINLLLHIAAANMEDKIINLLKEYNYIDTTIISCMVHRYLFKFRDLEPNLKLAALENLHSDGLIKWDVRRKLIDKAINNKFYAINPEYHLVDAQFISYAHQKNLKVFPWTINEQRIMRKLVALGVDGIITDDIALLNQVLSNSY